MNIIWFREDLRTHDNTALYHACAGKRGVLGLFFLTPDTWLDHHLAPCKLEFMLQGLKLLQADLAKLNIPLWVIKANTFSDVPQAFSQLLHHYPIEAVFCNRQYEVNESLRDEKVQALLEQQGIRFYSYDDQLIIPPGQIKTNSKNAYTVYTPFKKACYAYLKEQPRNLLPAPSPQPLLSIKTLEPAWHQVPSNLPEFKNTVDLSLWPAGEKTALKKLNHFLETKIHLYHEQRDFPAQPGTSTLSPYLASGMISARQCFTEASKLLHCSKTTKSGIETWLDELLWRDFYKNILVAFPRVCKNRPFKLLTENLVWSNNVEHLQAWQEGRTGFPLVDAAMRQLNQTGWMHNRLRMLTAMFFSKLLWLDWRLGEEYFMQHLIDGDFAANNGGWQWSASTGTDAVPYFRIFNPMAQSQKFDSDASFIKRYCPELKNLTINQIHDPYLIPEQTRIKLGYPAPIIDYKSARENAIKQFKAL